MDHLLTHLSTFTRNFSAEIKSYIFAKDSTNKMSAVSLNGKPKVA